MSVATGADVESICQKCGDVWHVVVAKVGHKIAKVQCKECGAYHRYRAPGGATQAGAVRRRSASKKKQPAPRIDAPAVEPDLSKPARPYSIREAYEVGERIDHPSFGTGVVEEVPGPGKIQVFFPTGRRVMAQAKPSNGLSKPPPIIHE